MAPGNGEVYATASNGRCDGLQGNGSGAIRRVEGSQAPGQPLSDYLVDYCRVEVGVPSAGVGGGKFHGESRDVRVDAQVVPDGVSRSLRANCARGDAREASVSNEPGGSQGLDVVRCGANEDGPAKEQLVASVVAWHRNHLHRGPIRRTNHWDVPTLDGARELAGIAGFAKQGFGVCEPTEPQRVKRTYQYGLEPRRSILEIPYGSRERVTRPHQAPAALANVGVNIGGKLR